MSVEGEAAELLLAARDDLLANGWCQNVSGDFGQSGGPVCALGALRRQHYVYGRGWQVTLYAKDALRYHLRESHAPPQRITDWNDEPGRTLDDVTAALTATAADLKERDV